MIGKCGTIHFNKYWCHREANADLHITQQSTLKGTLVHIIGLGGTPTKNHGTPLRNYWIKTYHVMRLTMFGLTN